MKTTKEVKAFMEAERSLQKVRKSHLAQRTKLAPRTIDGVFEGDKDPRLSTVMAVAAELGLELVLVPKSVAASLQGTQETGTRRVYTSLVQQAKNKDRKDGQ